MYIYTQHTLVFPGGVILSVLYTAIQYMKPCHTDLITYKRVNRNFESMPEANELQTTQVYIMTLMRLGEMAWGNQNNINID